MTNTTNKPSPQGRKIPVSEIGAEMKSIIDRLTAQGKLSSRKEKV